MTTQRKTSFAGDVAKLVSGTTAAQIIGVLVTPLLTRLYAPEDFGVLALFTSIGSILTVVACMRYELAIMVSESDEEAANVLGVSLSFAVLFALVLVPVIRWGREPLLSWLNAPELGDYLWLVPGAVVLHAAYQALNYWNSRTKQFGRLSVARVTMSVTTHFVKLVAGYAGYATSGALVGATMSGTALTTAVLGGQIWHEDGRLFRHGIHWRRMLRAIKRHRKFPLYSTWSGLLNSISWQLPAFLLSAFFSSRTVGYYSLGFRILHLPMSLVGGAIAQVFFQRAVEAKQEGRLSEVVSNVFRWLTMIGLFPMLVLAIIASDLFIVVFGSEWAEAGRYTQILSVWAFFWFVSSPLSTLFSVLERQEYGLRIQVAIFASRLISLVAGGLLANAYIALALFSASGVLVYGYLGFRIMHLVGLSPLNLARTVGRYVLLFVPAGGILLLLTQLDASRWLTLATAAGCVGVYLIYLIKNEPQAIQLLTRVRNDGPVSRIIDEQ